MIITSKIIYLPYLLSSISFYMLSFNKRHTFDKVGYKPSISEG